MNSRKRAFRLVAVLLGLSIFPIFEATCRLTGWGATTLSACAFEEFGAARPLFTLDQAEYRIAQNRRLYFADESFPAEKSPATKRIFIFGGSTVQGRPFSIPTSFGTFLKIGVKHADPDTEWQVVNCGGVSYASYRLLPIVRECVRYQPDLFIICTGHNEYLECLTYHEAISASPMRREAHNWLASLHSVRLLRSLMQPGTSKTLNGQQAKKRLLPEEVDALLDHEGGLGVYTRQALHHDDITTQFGSNLQQMVKICRNNDVPMMFVSPVSNLGDCPPFKSQFGDTVSTEARQRITAELKQASELQKDDVEGSIRLLKSIVEDDPAFAFSWYQLGRSYRMANRIDEARTAFVRARDEDVCPLRMTSALDERFRLVAMDNDVSYLDLQPLMQSHSRQGIVGDDVLVDHVHPSFRSNQLIALELISQLGLGKRDGWSAAAEADFDAHLQSLEDHYFLSGRRTLQSLQAWAAGRGDGPPLQLSNTSESTLRSDSDGAGR